jgi:hypothetical protein
VRELAIGAKRAPADLRQCPWRTLTSGKSRRPARWQIVARPPRQRKAP